MAPATPLQRYVHDREVVLGGRWWAHDDGEVAADRIIDRLGVDAGIAWAETLLAALRRRRKAGRR
jgi:hypothetical protein